jgi:hypothetical protein
MAVGRCGHLTWSEYLPDGGQRLVLAGPDAETLAAFPVENGWLGDTRFSPDGTLMAYVTLRSDLGFGDTTLVDLADLSKPALVLDFHANEPWGFVQGARGPGLWQCDHEWGGSEGTKRLEVLDAGGRQVLAEPARCEGIQVRDQVLVMQDWDRLYWWDLKAGTSGNLYLSADWDARVDCTPHLFESRVSADGTLLVLGELGGSIRVFDRVSGALRGVVDGEIYKTILAARGPSMLFASAAGMTALRADGTPSFYPGVTPKFAFSDGARAIVTGPSPQSPAASFAESPAAAFAVLDLASGAQTPVAGEAVSFQVSASEKTVAFVYIAESHGGYGVSVWREGVAGTAVVLDSLDSGYRNLHWVGEDGTVLLSTGTYGGIGGTRPAMPLTSEALELRGPDGGLRWSLGSATLQSLQEAGGLLLVVTGEAGLQHLLVLDPTAGTQRAVIEDEYLEVATDQAGLRLALRSVAWEDPPRPLYFGRMPAP